MSQRIRHWIVYGEGHRDKQKSNDQPIVVTWSQSNSASFTKSNISHAIFPVDKSVKLFLRSYTNQTYLLRVHNFHTSASVTIILFRNLWRSPMDGKQLKQHWRVINFCLNGKASKWSGNKNLILLKTKKYLLRSWNQEACNKTQKQITK